MCGVQKRRGREKRVKPCRHTAAITNVDCTEKALLRVEVVLTRTIFQIQGSLGNTESYFEKGQTTFIFFSLFIRNNKPWLQHSKMLRLLVQQTPTIRLAIHKAASENSPFHDTRSQKSAVVAVFLLTQHKKKIISKWKIYKSEKFPKIRLSWRQISLSRKLKFTKKPTARCSSCHSGRETKRSVPVSVKRPARRRGTPCRLQTSNNFKS